MGAVVKAKVGEWEDVVREVFYRRTGKELTGVVQGVSGERRLLVRFHYGFEKNMTSNQLTTLEVDKIP